MTVSLPWQLNHQIVPSVSREMAMCTFVAQFGSNIVWPDKVVVTLSNTLSKDFNTYKSPTNKLFHFLKSRY